MLCLVSEAPAYKNKEAGSGPVQIVRLAGALGVALAAGVARSTVDGGDGETSTVVVGSGYTGGVAVLVVQAANRLMLITKQKA